ncbi:MAG: HNH endonuclease signature motif containing protein [Patescibacteria group bacterium]
MRLNKTANIANSSGKNFDELISELYLKEKMTAKEIAEKILEMTLINITARSIQRKLKSLGIIRTYSEAFNLAIQKGRKSYEHLRKSIKSSELRKGIDLKLRFKILQRDRFKCVLCGKDAKEDILVVDHIIPVVKGGNNNLGNLRTLCRSCNHGKMLLEEKI